jgi:predicted amidohydrolase
MMPFSIAAVQMTVVIGDNMPKVRERLAFTMAIYPWVQMVVFSELALTGPDTRLAQALPGPLEAELCELARHYSIWLVPGSLYEHADGVVYNTTPVIDPNGTVVARHRKLFPFTPYEIGVAAGNTWVVFDVPDAGRFGVSICYDMWFPETSRSLACMGAELLIHPSLTGTIDRDIELSIGRDVEAPIFRDGRRQQTGRLVIAKYAGDGMLVVDRIDFVLRHRRRFAQGRRQDG